MNKIESAPKDGSRIILVWPTTFEDNRDFQIRECWWEDFSYLPSERSKKIAPCWQYINDSNFIISVKSPIWWLPLPEIK